MASFHSRLKSLGSGVGGLFGGFFWSNKCFNPSNFVSIQPCTQMSFFSLTLFGMESKTLIRKMLILLILTLYGTFDTLLQRWLLIRSKFFSNFPIERLHPTDKTSLVLIICLATIISYYHLVSLHEKNRDLQAASEWLCN